MYSTCLRVTISTSLNPVLFPGCVIRGKLSRPVHLKTPLVDVAKKSRPYLHYALDAADNRVNFYLVSNLVQRKDGFTLLQHSTFVLEHGVAGSSFSGSSSKT